ncbi:methyl-accepting chemotaxis protein [Pseudoduganella lutea]|nr:methyl-accepting chemotaxis protein [Pseudoduganella lutea]
MLSMGLCLLVFMVISSVLSVTMNGNRARERAVAQELPAQVGEIRNDILRQIGQALAVAQTLANDTYVHAWEDAGLPEAGAAAWTTYASHLKAKNKAATVFWVSKDTGKYFTDGGYGRTLSPNAASDGWFYGFLSSNVPYRLDIDKDAGSSDYMLFINNRVQTAGGKLAVAGIGLAVNDLATTIRNYRLGETGTVSLVRPNGTLLIDRDPQLADGKHALQDQPGFDAGVVKALLGEQSFAHAAIDGPEGRLFVASSYIKELNLYVLARVPEREVLGDIARSATISALIAGLVGGIIGLAGIWFISRAIAAPVMRAARMLGEIADGNGDLSRRMRVESEDEVGKLADAFNRFISSLNGTILQVRSSAEQISSATGEIATGNLDLSNRTEAQASNLEETAAAMEELTATVRQNADNAAQANTLVASTADAARKGGTVVSQVVDMMGAITDSSRRISDIIGVIDGIAFQTNILALNAAVEAARAGEQGRGFAVVASEVRNLAQRSATAAKEIKDLILASVDQVSAGSRLADGAGQAMGEIVHSVQQVADLVAQIANASDEQSKGIGQVNGAITEMDDVTQQNAALVEEAAAAAESLRMQAAALEQVVGTFKLDASAAAAAAAGTGLAVAPRAALRVR